MKTIWTNSNSIIKSVSNRIIFISKQGGSYPKKITLYLLNLTNGSIKIIKSTLIDDNCKLSVALINDTTILAGFNIVIMSPHNNIFLTISSIEKVKISHSVPKPEESIFSKVFYYR